MAIKIFQKLFKRRPKGHIVLMPEEAYAPFSDEPEQKQAEEAPVSMSAPAETEAPIKAEAPKPAVQEETSVPTPETPAEAAADQQPSDQEAPDQSAPEEAPEISAAEPEAEAPAPEKRAQAPFSIWMYGSLEDPATAKAQIRSGMISAFRSLSEDASGYSGCLPLGAEVSVCIHTDKTYVTEQAGYLIGCFKDTRLPDRDVQNAALMQIELFNAMIVYTLNPPYTKDDITALYSAAFTIAAPVRAFIVTEHMELYRWDKRLVISADSRTDFTVFTPVRKSLQANHIEADQVDAARRLRNMEVIRKQGVDMPADMPVQVRESEAKLRTPEDIVDRLACVFACCLKAQAHTSPDITAPGTWTTAALKRLDHQYGVHHLFTRKEADYILRGNACQHAQHLLHLESCAVLLWALGLIQMGWPSAPVDPETIFRIIRDADTEMLLKIAKPRPLNVILNMHDITCRLHSICVRADKDALSGYHLDHDVIYERHYALNWLVTANNISDWDLVIPKT